MDMASTLIDILEGQDRVSFTKQHMGDTASASTRGNPPNSSYMPETPRLQTQSVNASRSMIFSPQDLSPIVRTKKRGSKALKLSLQSLVKKENGLITNDCPECDETFPDKKSLFQHMETHNKPTAFECPHCDESFNRLAHLQGHLVTHGIDQQFQCPICFQKFSRPDCVRVHMRLHDTSKCAICEVCQKAFSTTGALNIHMRIHRGEKPFKCHLCGKCFTQKNHLITHIKRHANIPATPLRRKKLGPRMFLCDHCPRSFIRVSDYQRHVQWNHGAVATTHSKSVLNLGSNHWLNDVSENSKYEYEPMSPSVPTPQYRKIKTTLKKFRPKVVDVYDSTDSVCTIATQTDEDGGHVIIPSIYKSGSQMYETAQTPRGQEDDMYEIELFDEGMDRNYSSDEEDDDPQCRSSPVEIQSIGTLTEKQTLSKDEAFDAVVGLDRPDKLSAYNNESPQIEEFDALECFRGAEELESENFPTHSPRLEAEYSSKGEVPHTNIKEEFVISNANESLGQNIGRKIKYESNSISSSILGRNCTLESINQITGRVNLATNSDFQSNRFISTNLNSENNNKNVFGSNTNCEKEVKIQSICSKKIDETSIVRIDKRKKTTAPLLAGTPLLARSQLQKSFNTSNWKAIQKKGGPVRGKVKKTIGFTGATHLRLVRKSMMNYIHDKVEDVLQDSEMQEKDESDHKITETVDDDSQGRGKRQLKVKTHPKDFVCSSKVCDICNPVQMSETVPVKVVETQEIPPSLVPIGETSKKNELPDESKKREENERPPSQKLMQSQKLLKFLVSGDLTELKGTKFIHPDSDSTVKPGIFKETEKRFSKMTKNLISKEEMDEMEFLNVDSHKEFVSPPIETGSVCIPTFSCKLCGKEFRFEGKLHRHIESVHLNKDVYQSDMKPGRQSHFKYEQYIDYDDKEQTLPSIEEEENTVAQKENPEILAIRSEWDEDGENDDEDDGKIQELASQKTVTDIKNNTNKTSVTTRVFAQNYSRMEYSSSSSRPLNSTLLRPVITRENNRTNANTNDYYGRISVNLNKVSGIGVSSDRVSPEESYNYTEPTPMIKVAPTSSLDVKCRKLLEKLFHEDLLIECGLYSQHVSGILGKVLQHYGVKMIEDYGQGQYEVLKYNLWRLIEWKVTMEQMEEFYTEGKSVEEMMDDIMMGRVPIIAHHEPQEQAQEQQVEVEPHVQVSEEALIGQEASIFTGQANEQIDAVQITDENQLMLSQVASALGGQLNLDGITQVMLAQDVPPELLRGAHIVTIDSATGQVLSQVTADQVLLSGQHLQIDGQIVDTSGSEINMPTGTISMIDASQIDGNIKMEGGNNV